MDSRDKMKSLRLADRNNELSHNAYINQSIPLKRNTANTDSNNNLNAHPPPDLSNPQKST